MNKLDSKNKLSGVCPILPTPFNEDGSVDCESLRREVQFLIDSGVRGIALFGNASEAFALTPSEKDLIVTVVTEENNNRVPLIFGAGGTGTEIAIETSKWAESKGADLLMIMPPYLIKPDAQRVYEYFAEIAKAVNIPIMIQDAPNACGVNIPIDTIVKLANEYENIQYIKAEAPPTFVKAKRIIDATQGKLQVFGGLNGNFFYEELCVGICGTMPAGEFPDVLIKVYDLFKAGKKKEAKEVFYKYLPFIRLGTMPGGMAMAVHKEVLKRGGIFKTNKVRSPFIPADDFVVDIILDTIEDMDLSALSRNNK